MANGSFEKIFSRCLRRKVSYLGRLCSLLLIEKNALGK